jgi:hypothetical protein
MNAQPMITTLIDLHSEVAQPDFKLILAGGFGLYLKQLHRQSQAGIRTLIDGAFWPAPRATEDIDLMLPMEFLVSLNQMQALRTALDRLGFMPVQEAKFLHFLKQVGRSGRVKVDLLTGPVRAADCHDLKISPPRVRPKGLLELHAYITPEAIDFEQMLMPIEIEGSGQVPGALTVHVPHPFTYLLMKLHALADRLGDANRDLGRHHALDIYRIVAMLTRAEYDEVRGAVERRNTDPVVSRARKIILEYFSSATAVGVLRVREHELFSPHYSPPR